MTVESLSKDTVIARAPEAIEGELPEETVLLHVGSGKAVRINSTGAWLWARLEQPAEVGELADALASEHGIDRQRALADVRAFARELASRDLIQVTSP